MTSHPDDVCGPPDPPPTREDLLAELTRELRRITDAATRLAVAMEADLAARRAKPGLRGWCQSCADETGGPVGGNCQVCGRTKWGTR